MKTRLLLITVLSTSLGLHAATITLPGAASVATSPDAETDPNTGVSGGMLVDVYIDTVNAGTVTSGAWNGAAKGGTSISLLSALGGSLANIDLNTETNIAPDAIRFNTVTSTSGFAGDLMDALNLSSIVSAGLIQTWSATVNLTDLGLNLEPKPDLQPELRFGPVHLAAG